MELDELHVGNPATCSPGHGDTVAGRGVRVGRIEIDLAGTSGRDQRIGGPHGDDLAVAAIKNIGTKAALLLAAKFVAGNQVDRDMTLENRNVGRCPYLARQRFLH